MKKNILKSMFHFDRFDMEQYQKVINAKNGIKEIDKINKKFDFQLFILKLSVLFFLLVLTILSILTICFTEG
jgi:hypothetical protein